MTQKQLIVIVGPTAVGKTDLAIELAQYYKTEIISADSRQMYREMEIGTAKPSKIELEKVKHHFINSQSIHDFYSAGDYEREVIELLDTLFLIHDKVILVGGSGLFVSAVCKGFDEIPETDLSVRETLNERFKKEGLVSILEELQKLDPFYCSHSDLNNSQRIIRALEVCLCTGKPFSSFQQNKPKDRNFKIIKIGLELPREELYSRINNRVDVMMQHGLLNEVLSLFPYKHLNSLQTVGYKEIIKYLENELSLEAAINLVKQNTRRFAKRQLTWFKRDEEIVWFHPNSIKDIINNVKLI